MYKTRTALKFFVATLASVCLPLEIHASDTGQNGPSCQLVTNVDIKLRPHRCSALYPTRARQRGIEGWAEVSFTINSDGRVSDVFVLEEHPPLYFDQSALRMAERFRFDPALLNGQTIRDARYLFTYLVD